MKNMESMFCGLLVLSVLKTLERKIIAVELNPVKRL